MLTKNTPATNIKAGREDGLKDGEFIVYPSTFVKIPDSYGDIVAPGAFLKDIETWMNSGLVLPGLFGHRMDDPDFWVAGAQDMGEDNHGWWVKGMFDLESPKGSHVYRLVKGRRLNQLSFAYDVIDEAGVELDHGVRANELRELKVYEFSFVPIGANQDTSVVAVKSILDHVTQEVKAGRVLSAKNESALRDAHAAIGTVLGALESTSDEEKASGPDASRQAPAGDTPEGQPREASQKSSVDPSALLEAISAQIEVEFA
ncbi:primosome assembly protein PriA [Mycobacterium sp. NS-7484]|uniref:HK97 family phage prohead protease n=1 Tax=Mycobacterium sp. NS-7484 TaxID=1834161 RepID=UPI00096D2839|nr:HK97 family phage prohead protease [Mycobacterium sp. NS-7484]OMB98420.1 primosome assembly protein PriA [Mycobacterium sp. NS-7484]